MSINKHFVVKKGLIVNATSANVIAEFKSNDAIFIPEGTTGERPASAANGYFRYNSTLAEFEGYQAGTWSPVGSGANVTAGTVTPVTDQKLGDMWFNTTEEILYLYVNNGVDDVWLDILTDPSRPSFTAAAGAPGGAGYIDVWYDTGDEVLSMWVNDGTNDVWMDIITSASIANQYVDTQSAQSFTNTETAQARENIDAGHLMTLGYNNLIINSRCTISQENGVSGSNTSGYYTADQWEAQQGGGHDFDHRIIQGSIFLGDNTGYQRIYCQVANAAPATGSYELVQQPVEGVRAQGLRWGTSEAQPVTVGISVWGDNDGKVSFFVRNASIDRSYVKEIPVTSVITFHSFVIPGPTSGTWYANNLAHSFWGICGATGTTYQTTSPETWVTGNYLGTANNTNYGNFATDSVNFAGLFAIPGEHNFNLTQDQKYICNSRGEDEELRKCQRYFEVFNEDEDLNTWFGTGYARTTTEGRFVWKYREIKRVPTTSHSMTASDYGIDQTSGGNKAGTSVVFNSSAAESVDIRLTCAASLVAGEAVTMIGNTKITSDARM